MAREELVNSAVSFLQDPSVATSPLDKRRAFLESKNLTPEEIDLAFAQAGQDPHAGANYSYPSQQRLSSPPPPPPPPHAQQPYGYGHYSSYPNQWPQQPPPPPPRRDWRDWFIMATVTTGVGYGLFTLAKRYVVPMISPPTPPQIEQDKTAIDAEFTKAFALIDQLATDTAALKSAEEERTEKLDSALSEVESVIAELKAANKKREDDAARTGDEIRALREMIPKALEGWKSDGDNRLKELNTELKSLKMLVGNRVGSSAPNTTRTTSGTSTPAAATSSTATEHQNQQPALSSTASAPAPGITTPRKDSPFSFEGRSGRTIPAWQKAAAEKEKENEKAAQSSVTDAGTSEANADV